MTRLEIRSVRDADLEAIDEMIDDFVRGHPAVHHPRPIATLRAAYIDRRVANLLVAERDHRVIGMVQWALFYDMFWAMFGVQAEWLYVRPEARGLGIAAALLAEVCSLARREGAEFLHGGSDDPAVARLYERIAIGHPARQCHVSAEAFQVFADLAGTAIRDLVRQLPTRALNHVPARPRDPEIPAKSNGGHARDHDSSSRR